MRFSIIVLALLMASPAYAHRHKPWIEASLHKAIKQVLMQRRYERVLRRCGQHRAHDRCFQMRD